MAGQGPEPGISRGGGADLRSSYDASVLFVMSSLARGGSESKTVWLANALAALDAQTRIAYLNPPLTLEDRIDDAVDVYDLERRGKYSPKAVVRLADRLAHWRPDVVFALNLYACLYVLPARWRLAKGVPRPALVALVNTTDFVRRRDEFFARLYAASLRRFDRIVFGCEHQLEKWVERYRLPREHCAVIYNGVDAEQFSRKMTEGDRLAERSAHGLKRASFVIVGVGRLMPEKNFDLLIRAVGRLVSEGRDIELVIVGEGSGREFLGRVAREENVEQRVHLPGPSNDVTRVLEIADTFVLPSRAVETFSNAALEAMAMECPVVLSNVGGAPEMVEDGVSGCLFEREDLGGLVATLRGLIEDPDRRASLAAAARRRVRDKFSKDKMLRDYVHQIQQFCR